LCHSYLKKGVEAPIPFFGFGMAYIRFAKEESELYKMLFINPDKKGESMLDTLSGIRSIVINSIEKTYRFNEKEAKRLFRDLWLAAHSIATLCVGGICPFSDGEIAKILTGFSVGICKSIKEIKGFVDDSFDRDEVFGKIIKE
ncbi:MAG: TetR-like C-terminal domain-containing protein, partial [Clostridia bacterium]|nr:TetR-like C-terminal domain-containing protein [Clostridia bacterium]